jgi:pSer/pThr/pTyr-binding forkhead associated (FHA) protein
MAVMNVKLLIVQGKPAGKCLSFASGEYYFGRGPECQVRADSEWVSRQHCLLRVTCDGVSIRDLGSRNGTLVNGVLVTSEQFLSSGDQLQIGPLVFEVQFERVLPAAETVTKNAGDTRQIVAETTDLSEIENAGTVEMAPEKAPPK